MRDGEGRRRGKDVVSLDAYLMSTGQHLASLQLKATDSVGSLCRAVAEEIGNDGRHAYTYHVLAGPGIVEHQTPLAVAGFRDGDAVDFIRCRSHSVMTVASDGDLKVWSAHTGECGLTLSCGKLDSRPPTFSLDGNRVLDISNGGSVVKVLGALSGDCLVNLDGHGKAVNFAAFSPEGRRVVTASDDCTAKVWEACAGECVHTCSGHLDVVNSATFSRDGLRIVTASVDGTAKIWNAKTGQCLRTLEGHGSASVNWAMFSLDGSSVVTASDDRTARIWEAESGLCTITLQGHTSPVLQAFFAGAL